MKRFLFIVCLSLAWVMVSCREPEPPQDPQLPVNYYNVSGHWQLVGFNGHTLDQDTYLYLSLDRREHTFELRDNLQSMYGQLRTGSYLLEADDDTDDTIMSGSYDNGMGEWNHRYTVSFLTASDMVLTATDDPACYNNYHRVDSLPVALR